MGGFSSTEATAFNCKALQSVCLVALSSWSNVARSQQGFFFSPFHLLLVDRSSGQLLRHTIPSSRPDRPIHSGKKEADPEEEAGDGPG